MTDEYPQLETAEQILLAGESEGAQNLMRFNRALEKGETPAPDVLQFLAKAFAKILDGEEPKDALNLRTKQGRKPPSGKEMDERMAKRVVPVIQLMCKGLTRDKAIEQVSNNTGLGFKTILTEYNNQKDIARWALDLLAKADRPKEKK